LIWIFDEEVLAVVTAVVVIASVFAIVQAFKVERVVEPFSELGLLGPNMMIGDYPKEVVVGNQFQLHVYVGNHEGKTMFYKILVKAGNSTSYINETTPLYAQPIKEIYAVLMHNTSKIIPLNLTLYHPADNLRLVFEMWVFNETSGGFAYHGRWNQLWVNVTGPAPGSPRSEPLRSLPLGAETFLVYAYNSIRRAEDSGGNVINMVLMLDRAIEYAQEENIQGTEALVKQILSIEPEVTKAGLWYRRNQLIYAATVSSSIVATGVGLFLYVRHRIWLLLLKSYGGWKVKPLNNRGLGSTPFEKKVRSLLSSKSDVRVNDVVALADGLGRKRWEVTREVFNLARSNAVRLEDPRPPGTFAAYLLSIHNLSFPATAVLLALTITTIYLMPAAFLRYVLGSLFVLFLPGYSLVEALYPKREELSSLERLALSIGLSLALVPLVGLILNYTPWGIRLDPIVTSLSLLTISLMLLASYRKYGLLKLTVAVA
jgi:uncharacterized membrane protein